MGRRQRYFKSDEIYFVTGRTHQQMFFFCPTDEVIEIILGILASVADKFDVEVFAFIFMSNHFHMMLRSHSCQISDFMCEFNSQVAKALNKHWGRTGHFFEDRFKEQEILDDEMLVQKLRYTVCNPCESDLVRHPKLWPGLSSWRIHESGQPLVGKRLDKDEYRRLKRNKATRDLPENELIEMATHEYELDLAKLPMWEELDDEAYHQKARQEIVACAEELAKRRRKPCLGVEKILAQRYDDRPANPKRSPCPPCLSSSPKRRAEYLEEYYEVVVHYQRAVARFRKGKSNVTFPDGTIPPGHRHVVGAPRPRDRLLPA